MKLVEKHEIIGILQSYLKENNQYRLIFTFTQEIVFPTSSFSQKKLVSLIDKRIEIFNFDVYYKIRIMEGKK